MLSFSLPSNVDAQLFEMVLKGAGAQDVIRLLDAGARLDVRFSLDHQIKRGQTTHIALTAIEALFVGWDLLKLSQVVAYIGKVPDVVFPNISSAFHQMNLVKDDLYRSQDYSSEKRLLFGLVEMMNNCNFWTTPFLAPSMWECIAHKDLETNQHSHLPAIAHALRNLPKISEPKSLDRVSHIPKSNDVKCGMVLCTKMGVHEDLHHSKEYQYLYNKVIGHTLEPVISSCVLQWEVDEQNSTASKTQRKM